MTIKEMWKEGRKDHEDVLTEECAEACFLGTKSDYRLETEL